MRAYEVTTPASTPVLTTAEAKTHLKVDITTDDTLIDNLIASATQISQEYTNRFFINTTITQKGNNFDDLKELYKSTVGSVTHIKYYDNNDALQTLATSVYYLNNVVQPAQISLKVSQSFPSVADKQNAVECEYVVGYGASASDVPEAIKQAVLLTVGNWYENRSSVVIGRISTELPMSAKWLLDSYKVQVIR